MAAFDVPQLMAVTRSKICKCGMQSLPRSIILLYYWVFSTPVVSLVFGSYLYICINWFHLHFDESFSSLRIANYKSFSRCHIKSDGDLEVYTLGIDKRPSIKAGRVCRLLVQPPQVPKEWALDPSGRREVGANRSPVHVTSKETPEPVEPSCDCSRQTVRSEDHRFVRDTEVEVFVKRGKLVQCRGRHTRDGLA